MGLLEVGNLNESIEIMTTTITDKILHHEDLHDSPFEDFVAYHFRKNGFGVPGPVLHPPCEYLKARVDDGRWIVDCPNCNSALCITGGDVPKFVCAECGSPELGGHWRYVEYPKDRQEIERLLLLRPAGMGRGFIEGTNIPVGGPRFYSEDDLDHGDASMKGQTVEELRAENERLRVGF